MLSDFLPGMMISAFSGKLFGCDYLKETTKNPKIPKDSINRRLHNAAEVCIRHCQYAIEEKTSR
jgi:hypothetical protein